MSYNPTKAVYTQLGLVVGGIGECADVRFPGIYVRVDHPEIFDFINGILLEEGILFIYFPSSPVGLNGKVELKCCKSKRFSNIKPQKTSVVVKLSDCTFVKLMTEMLLRPSSNCNLQRKRHRLKKTKKKQQHRPQGRRLKLLPRGQLQERLQLLPLLLIQEVFSFITGY